MAGKLLSVDSGRDWALSGVKATGETVLARVGSKGAGKEPWRDSSIQQGELMTTKIHTPPPAASANLKFNDRFVNVSANSGYGAYRSDRAAFEAYLPPDADAETLGQTVLMALSRSRTIAIEEIPVFFDRNAGQLLYEAWVTDVMERFA